MAEKPAPYYTDFIPYAGLPILVLHFLMIGTFFFVEFYLFPHINSHILKDVLTGILNPPLLVLSFYIACLIYLFTKDEIKLRNRFTVSAIILAGLGAVFNIHLPEVILPPDLVSKLIMMLLGAGLGTGLCIIYRKTFCGKITPLL